MQLNELNRQTVLLVICILALICFFSSFVLFICATYIKLIVDNRMRLIETYNSDVLPIIFLFVGIFNLVQSVSCIVVCMRLRDPANRPELMKLMLPILCAGAVLVLFEVSSAITSFVHISILDGEFGDGLQKGMAEYTNGGELKVEMDTVQIEYKCCGDKSYVDWFQYSWIDKGYLSVPRGSAKKFTNKDSAYYADDTPFSCCDTRSPRPCIHHHVHDNGKYHNYNYQIETTLYVVGCRIVLMGIYGKVLLIVGIIAVLIAAVKVIVLVLFRLVHTSLKKAQEVHDWEAATEAYIYFEKLDDEGAGKNKSKEGESGPEASTEESGMTGTDTGDTTLDTTGESTDAEATGKPAVSTKDGESGQETSTEEGATTTTETGDSTINTTAESAVTGGDVSDSTPDATGHDGLTEVAGETTETESEALSKEPTDSEEPPSATASDDENEPGPEADTNKNIRWKNDSETKSEELPTEGDQNDNKESNVSRNNNMRKSLQPASQGRVFQPAWDRNMSHRTENKDHRVGKSPFLYQENTSQGKPNKETYNGDSERDEMYDRTYLTSHKSNAGSKSPKRQAGTDNIHLVSLSKSRFKNTTSRKEGAKSRRGHHVAKTSQKFGSNLFSSLKSLLPGCNKEGQTEKEFASYKYSLVTTSDEEEDDNCSDIGHESSNTSSTLLEKSSPELESDFLAGNANGYLYCAAPCNGSKYEVTNDNSFVTRNSTSDNISQQTSNCFLGARTSDSFLGKSATRNSLTVNNLYRMHRAKRRDALADGSPASRLHNSDSSSWHSLAKHSARLPSHTSSALYYEENEDDSSSITVRSSHSKLGFRFKGKTSERSSQSKLGFRFKEKPGENDTTSYCTLSRTHTHPVSNSESTDTSSTARQIHGECTASTPERHFDCKSEGSDMSGQAANRNASVQSLGHRSLLPSPQAVGTYKQVHPVSDRSKLDSRDSVCHEILCETDNHPEGSASIGYVETSLRQRFGGRSTPYPHQLSYYSTEDYDLIPTNLRQGQVTSSYNPLVDNPAVWDRSIKMSGQNANWPEHDLEVTRTNPCPLNELFSEAITEGQVIKRPPYQSSGHEMSFFGHIQQQTRKPDLNQKQKYEQQDRGSQLTAGPSDTRFATDVPARNSTRSRSVLFSHETDYVARESPTLQVDKYSTSSHDNICRTNISSSGSSADALSPMGRKHVRSYQKRAAFFVSPFASPNPNSPENFHCVRKSASLSVDSPIETSTPIPLTDQLLHSHTSPAARTMPGVSLPFSSVCRDQRGSVQVSSHGSQTGSQKDDHGAKFVGKENMYWSSINVSGHVTSGGGDKRGAEILGPPHLLVDISPTSDAHCSNSSTEGAAPNGRLLISPFD